MVCTWHLPVRGKVEKRKHMDRASSRSRSASMNVGYLRGRGAALMRPLRLGSRGASHPAAPARQPPQRPHSLHQARPGHHHLPDGEPGHAPGAGSTGFPVALGGTAEPGGAHLALRVRRGGRAFGHSLRERKGPRGPRARQWERHSASGRRGPRLGQPLDVSKSPHSPPHRAPPPPSPS